MPGEDRRFGCEEEASPSCAASPNIEDKYPYTNQNLYIEFRHLHMSWSGSCPVTNFLDLSTLDVEVSDDST